MGDATVRTVTIFEITEDDPKRLSRLHVCSVSLKVTGCYTPTASFNYITICDKVQMPANGGTTCRFMRARSLVPPTVQLGNSGIDPPAQIPQRDIIDAAMAVFGTGCVSDCAAA